MGGWSRRYVHDAAGHGLGLVAIRLGDPGHLELKRLVLALVVKLVEAVGVDGWGWVGVGGWIEESEAVRMSCCGLGMGG